MTAIRPEDRTQDTRLPWRGIIASLVRQLGRQAAVFDTDIAYEDATLAIARTGDGYTFAVRDVPGGPQAADASGVPACYAVTRESMGDALASHPLTEHLTPERRERMARALLGMAGVPAVTGAGFYMEGVKAERERIVEVLRRAAAGRREYAGQAHEDSEARAALLKSAEHYESAVWLIEDARNMLDVMPSWMWTDEENASLREATNG